MTVVPASPSKMSLARAFTKRSRRLDISWPTVAPLPGQEPPPAMLTSSASMRRKERFSVKRTEISSPVELISTTNMLSYNAPDIATLNIAALRSKASVESPTSRSSSDESDSNSSTASQRSRETLTDASSVDESPTSSPPYHKVPIDLFRAGAAPTSNPQSDPIQRPASSGGRLSHQKSFFSDSSTPPLPQRAPSHSKSAHQQVARQRSMGHVSIGSIGSREERASLDMFKGAVDPSHPFNQELEKLNEVAEEFNTTVRSVEMDVDAKTMFDHGLAKFSADDYIIEIRPLFYGLFSERHLAPAAWI